MADFSVSLTVEDAKVNDLLDALRWHWGPKSIDPVVEYTTAELKAKLKTSVERSVKDIYKRHKEFVRSQQAIDHTIEVT